MATFPEETPGTQEKAQVVFSNTAGTLIENVTPANPLPVYSAAAPIGTQDVNITKVAGASVATGHGTAAGALRVELPTDGTGVVGLAAGTTTIVTQPTGTNLHVVLDTTSTTAVTGTTSNASSTVATTAVNVPTVAYLYGYNGATWDQLNTTTPAQTFVSNSFTNVAAGTATTVIKSGAGTCASIVINTLGVANTLTVYDNTAGSGTKLATINTAAAVAGIPFTYGAAMSTGITCVSAGGTGADYTVTYR